MTGKFDKVFIVAEWQVNECTTNLQSAKCLYMYKLSIENSVQTAHIHVHVHVHVHVLTAHDDHTTHNTFVPN